MHDSKSCGWWDCLPSSTTNIPYGDLPLLRSLTVYSHHNSIWGCRLTPDLILSCVLAFSLVKRLQIYCYIYTTGECSTPPCPGIAFRTALAVATAHKGGRFKFIACANHCSRICTQKHCSSQGATPSMLTTARSTTEPPCDVSQSICSLEQMNTRRTLQFQHFFLCQLMRYHQKMAEQIK